MSTPSQAVLASDLGTKPNNLVRHDAGLLSDPDVYLFNEGTHHQLYNKLGAHETVMDGVRGTCFGVWAPNAERVTVMGDFNDWNKSSHELRPRGSSGIWQGFIPGVVRGHTYKYHIASRYHGFQVDKAD